MTKFYPMCEEMENAAIGEAGKTLKTIWDYGKTILLIGGGIIGFIKFIDKAGISTWGNNDSHLYRKKKEKQEKESDDKEL